MSVLKTLALYEWNCKDPFSVKYLKMMDVSGITGFDICKKAEFERIKKDILDQIHFRVSKVRDSLENVRSWTDPLYCDEAENVSPRDARNYAEGGEPEGLRESYSFLWNTPTWSDWAENFRLHEPFEQYLSNLNDGFSVSNLFRPEFEEKLKEIKGRLDAGLNLLQVLTPAVNEAVNANEVEQGVLEEAKTHMQVFDGAAGALRDQLDKWGEALAAAETAYTKAKDTIQANFLRPIEAREARAAQAAQRASLGELESWTVRAIKAHNGTAMR